MRKFSAENWFDIKGRGRVAAVRNDEEFERGKGHMLGEIVSIDGETYKVLGVESFAITPIRKGAPIGLLVVPVSAQGSSMDAAEGSVDHAD